MKDWTIGVISPRGYDHSAVFNDVAFAMAGAFHDLGSRTSLGILNGVDCETIIYPSRQLVLGANLLPHYTGIYIEPDAVLLNLEQHTSPWMVKPYLELLRKHEVWDYSQRNIDFLREFGIKAKLCRIGYHPVLTRFQTGPEDIDVLFYGSNTPRRVEILRAMGDLGINVQCLFGCYGPERDAYISRAKIVLNLHAYNRSPLEIVRLQLLFANRKCVLTESCAPDDPEWNLYRGCMAEGGSADHMAQVAQELLADEPQRFRLGRLGHEAFKLRTQADYLRPLVAAPAPA